MAACFIVTRPAPTAAKWIDALRAHGLEACGLPLIAIVPEEMSGALRDAREHLAQWQAVMFVSGNAVRCFLGTGADAIDVPADAAVRAWAPGSGTRLALIQAGWPADRIDSPDPVAHQFESESLWSRVAPQVRTGTRVLIVRGSDVHGRVAGRKWLAGQIGNAGGMVAQVVAYRRCAPELTAAAGALLARAHADRSVWLFSSAEALNNLAAIAPHLSWSGARAIVTHERIGRAAQALGFDVIGEARPTLPDVLAIAETLT